jgi:hypothetical protein
VASIDEKTVIQQADSAVSREINGEVVLLTPEDSRVHVLDEVGSRVWTLCADAVSIDSLASAIASEYEVDQETAARDIIDFVDRLVGLGVVKAA